MGSIATPTSTNLTQCPLNLLDLPPEILFVILGNLDALDIISLRQTCSAFLLLSHERAIWLNILHDKIPLVPLPRDMYLSYFADKYLQKYTSHGIEAALTEAAYASKAWTQPRLEPYKIPREKIGSTLLGLQLFADRWLLAFYFEGAAHLYDTHCHGRSRGPSDGKRAGYSSRRPVLRATLFLENSSWITYEASLDAKGEKLILASSRSMPPHRMHIYEVDLMVLANSELFVPDAFRLVKQIILPVYKTVKALDPSRRLLASSSPGSIQLFKWDSDDPDYAHRKAPDYALYDVDTELEGLWNGIVAVHFIDEYLLLFRVRSIEAFPHDQPNSLDANGKPNSLMKHEFPFGFREIRFSGNTIRQDPLSGVKTMETAVLAYDLIQGLFRYKIQIRTNPMNPQFASSLEVTLTDVDPLALRLGHNYGNFYVALPEPEDTSEPLGPHNTTYTANFTPVRSSSSSTTAASTPRHINTSATTTTPNGNHNTHNTQSPTASTPTHHRHPETRGFISALAMGSQGKRAIWIARKRTTTSREVIVWSQDGLPAKWKEEHRRSDEMLPAFEIPKIVVHVLESYDLRDDITCCTFSEFTGTIYLGLRSGEIAVLRPNYQSP